MRYQVVGKNHRVFGKSFGEFFERNLPEAQERHLIGGGFIVRAPIVVAEPNANFDPFRASFEAAVEESENSAAEIDDDAPTDVEDTSTEPRRDEF